MMLQIKLRSKLCYITLGAGPKRVNTLSWFWHGNHVITNQIDSQTTWITSTSSYVVSF